MHNKSHILGYIFDLFIAISVVMTLFLPINIQAVDANNNTIDVSDVVLGSTQDSSPLDNIIVASDGDVLFANNSLLALPGTNYFLRHKNIVPDSVIIQVEVRDKKQNTLVVYPLAKGNDYTVDVKESLLQLSEPAYYMVDNYWYGNADEYYIFLKVYYQYIDYVQNLYIDQEYVSLDGGINWFVQTDGQIIAEQIFASDIGTEYDTVKTQRITLGTNKTKHKGQKVYNADDVLIDGFLIGIVDTKFTQRKITGNRALASSGDISFNKTLLTEGKVQIYYRGVIAGEYLLNASVDTQREDDNLLEYIDPSVNYAVYGDNSQVNDLSTKASGLLYLLVEKDNSWAEYGLVAAKLPDKELTEFNRSLDGFGIHYEDIEATKYGVPLTTIDTYYAKLEEKRTRNELLSTGSVIYYLRFTSIIATSLNVSLEVRDHESGNVVRTQKLTSGTDFEVDANSGRLLFAQPIKQFVPSGIIVTDDTGTDNDIYIIASYNYSVSTDNLDQSILAIRAQQAISDSFVLGIQHQEEDQLDSTFKASAVDANIHLGNNHVVDVELAQSNVAIEAPYTSDDGGITYSQETVNIDDNNKTDDAVSIKGKYNNQDTKDNLALNYYYKNIPSNFSQKTSSNLAGKELIGFDTQYDISSRANVRVKFDDSQALDNLLDQNWQDSQKIVIQSEYLIRDVLKFTTAFSDSTTEKHTKDATKTIDDRSTQLAVKSDYKYSKDTIFTLRQQLTLNGKDNEQTSIGVQHQLLKNLKISANTTFYPELDNKSSLDASYKTDNGITIDLGITQSSQGLNTTRIGGKYDKDGISLGAGIAQNEQGGVDTSLTGGYKEGKLSLTTGVKQDKEGALTSNAGGKYAVTTDSSQTYNVSAYNQTNSKGKNTQALVLGAQSPVGKNTNVGVDTSINISGDNVRNSVGSNIKHKFNDKQSIKAALSRYTENENGRVGSGYETKISGNINKQWALSVDIGQGFIENASSNLAPDKRTHYAIGTSYIRSNVLSGAILKSSLKYRERRDRGLKNRDQRIVDAKIKGKYNDDITLSSILGWTETENLNDHSIEASNNRFDINAAYRPLAHNKFNSLFKYTWVDNIYATGQIQENAIEADKGHVISSDLFYKINTSWQLGTKLAQRYSKERFGSKWFDNTLSLVAGLIQYEVVQDTHLSLEFRSLYNKRTDDQKDGLVLEVKRRFNEYIEAAIGYNFSGYSADLAALDYNVEGWYLRATGVLY